MLSLFTSGAAGILPGKWKDVGKILEGLPADLTVLDFDLERVVRVEEWKSKARLSPWNGRRLRGWPIMTFVGGRMVHPSEGPIEEVD
jgi:dihydroorotase